MKFRFDKLLAFRVADPHGMSIQRLEREWLRAQNYVQRAQEAYGALVGSTLLCHKELKVLENLVGELRSEHFGGELLKRIAAELHGIDERIFSVRRSHWTRKWMEPPSFSKKSVVTSLQMRDELLNVAVFSAEFNDKLQEMLDTVVPFMEALSELENSTKASIAEIECLVLPQRQLDQTNRKRNFLLSMLRQLADQRPLEYAEEHPDILELSDLPSDLKAIYDTWFNRTKSHVSYDHWREQD
jgi:hypothetical protein